MKRSIVLITLLGLFLTFKPPVDPDFGWHLKYGEYFVQNRQLLRENIHSFNMPNYTWANSYWIAQTIMYLLYTSLGPIGMGVVLALLLCGGSVAILNTAQSQKNLKSNVFIASLLLFIMYAQYTVIGRPLLFSCLFMLLLLQTLLFKPRNIKFLPVLFLIWANTHADYVLGLFILALFNIQTLLTHRLKKEKIPQYIYSILCPAVTLINPFDVHLWATLFKETGSNQFRHIMEWLPLLNKNFTIFFTVAAGFIAAATIDMRNKKQNLWLLASLLVFFVLSLRFSYAVRIFMLIGAFPLMNFIGRIEPIFKDLFSKRDILKIKRTAYIVAGLVFLAVEISFVKNLQEASDPQKWAPKANYPYEAIQVIKEQGIQGRMFNYYAWGGYLIWQLPEHKTFIDGRMPSWREGDYSTFDDYIAISKTPAENYALLDDYEVNWILMQEDAELARYLLEEHPEDWTIMFQDGVAVVLRRER